MFQIGDRVIHQITKQSGKVVGYGHQIVDGTYQPTIVVRVVGFKDSKQEGFVEDLSSAWRTLVGELKSQVA